MTGKLFKELFGGILTGEASLAFAGATVPECSLDLDKREFSCTLSCPEYVALSLQDRLIFDLKDQLRLQKCTAEFLFSDCPLSEEICRDTAICVRRNHAAFNGFFNGAVFHLDGSDLKITLQHGGLKTLTDYGFEEEFNRELNRRFSQTVTVTFDGQVQEVQMQAPPVEEVPLPEPPPPEEAPAQPDFPQEEEVSLSPEGLPSGYSDFKLFYGRNPRFQFTRMIDIVPPSDESVRMPLSGYGEVFDFQTKNINTKKGPMVVVTFCVSDSTNSIYCKMFLGPEELGQIKPLKDGVHIVFNGLYSYDKFLNDFVLQPKCMATVQKEVEQDRAEEKRVELHCHTNMSMKDAVCGAENVIRQAYDWGHKAIAITDHGVVQSYPAAAAAVKAIRKSGGDFKVIYGVEDYFVDDTKGETDVAKLERYHQIILVKNLVGLKNLYQLVSTAHVRDFHKKPLTRRTEIESHREGLLIGSACEAGELYQAILRGAPWEQLLEIASFYDYLEIQPVGNNEFMVRASSEPDKVSKKGVVTPNRYRKVVDLDVIRDFNRQVVRLGDELGKPVVATGDVHFLHKEDGIIRKILLASQGYTDFDHQAPLYFHTTDEMLEEFSYFGDRAKEFVVDNPNRIAEMIDGSVIPVPDGNYPPKIEGSDEELERICWERAHRMYGEQLPEVVQDRLATELKGIIENGYSIMYITAQKLVSYSEEHGYLVGSRGSVGSSFVATMAGISEVNPLPPHYYCPKCQWNQFFSSKDVGSGFDLPEKKCPNCGTELKRDGHDIPFATFLGFNGDKVPDIDLNFSDVYQSEVQKYTETLFGRENVFKAGTITTIAEKTAFGYVKKYCELKGITLSQAEMNRLAKTLDNCKIKATSGQHPAGMVVVPRDKSIYDFCPIQHPADDPNSDILTTHFDFHSIHDTILKLDELGHVVPTTYKYLEEYSGVKIGDISMSDPDVYSLFTSPKALGVTPEDIDSQTGTYCIPEFGTAFVRGMLIDCRPKTFADLLQISGLSHGTDVWLGNAKELIDNGTCTISEVIGTRDNIMIYLINQGMDKGRAFKITETVRKGLVAKGKVSKEDWEKMEEDMRAVGVPEWYIASCQKIKYMFPKAHAAAYVISALRLAWYKVHKPVAFYCAYFSARPEDVEISVILKGREAVRAAIREIRQKGKEASPKELAVLDNLYIFNEIMARGIEVLPIDLRKSHAVRYLPEDGKIRLPFGSVSGMGDQAAYAVYETAQKGNYLSREDFANQAGVSKTLIQTLSDLGVFASIPENNQLSMF